MKLALCLAFAVALAMLVPAGAQTVSGGANTSTNTTTFNSLPVGTTVPAASNSIAAAGTLQSVFTAGSIANGCYIQNIQPNGTANTGTLIVEPDGITGTALDAAAVVLQPGQQFGCAHKPTTAITAYSTTVGLTFVAGRF